LQTAAFEGELVAIAARDEKPRLVAASPRTPIVSLEEMNDDYLGETSSTPTVTSREREEYASGLERHATG